MQAFRDRPIRQKLVIITVATTAAALLLAGSGIVLADSVLFRGYLRRDLTALGRIVADESSATVAFEDPEAASRTLGALRARVHVVGACIYRQNGTILAVYSRQGSFDCPSEAAQEKIQFGDDGVTVSEPIQQRGKRMGTLVMLYDLGEIADRIRIYGLTVFSVLLASTVLALLFSSRLRTVIAVSIERLARAASAVSETHDYTVRAERLSGDELGMLVDRFNEMLSGIEDRDDRLKSALTDREVALGEVEKERERFQFMAESMPQKIFTATPSGENDYLNAQFTEYTGLSIEEMKGWGWTHFVHPDDLEENVRSWQASIQTGKPFLLEHRFRRADGKYRWHLTRALAMRDTKGNVSMWIGSSTDIHEQKEKEQALRRANDDLQQFAYSASHDLQEPIRNVAVYSEIIGIRYRSQLDEEGHLFLDFLTEGGRRLSMLVNDLLAYTRASTAELSDVTVDAGSVLRDLLTDLSETVRSTGAEVTYGNLPEVHMGESHLRQVFQNLISNALKYRGEEPPRVHISASRQGVLWRFSVQDNGIGIDPQYKEKIFGVFKRLHHDQKYAGTGIGLAICQRVVERYGGSIWVESEPGHGSTFVFTVPQHAQPVRSATVESTSS